MVLLKLAKMIQNICLCLLLTLICYADNNVQLEYKFGDIIFPNIQWQIYQVATGDGTLTVVPSLENSFGDLRKVEDFALENDNIITAITANSTSPYKKG